MSSKAGSKEIQQFILFNGTQIRLFSKPGAVEANSDHFSKFISFILKYSLPKTQITFKWKLRLVSLFGRKTQYNTAWERNQPLPQTWPATRLKRAETEIEVGDNFS